MSDMIFSGPVKGMKKDSLLNLSQALNLDQNGTVPVLTSRILAHMAANPHLAHDPRFQQLFVYRPKDKGKGGLKYAKKSTNKAAEDQAEERKAAEEPKDPSGCVFFLFFSFFFFALDRVFFVFLGHIRFSLRSACPATPLRVLFV